MSSQPNGSENPAFLPFALPYIGEEEIAAVTDCLRSGWITTGPRTKLFEADFAAYVGSRHAIAVNSCTAALHLALEGIGVGPGDEVLVPTMTFAATAEVVRYLAARPILIDCHPQTLNLDPGCLAAFLEENCEPGEGGAYNRRTGGRVRAIVPVHYGGLPCAMQILQDIADRYGLTIIEDAAHAIPAGIERRSVGTMGIAGAFSFYANKNMTTGEGGMLVTDDDALADRARLMSLHGISRDAWLRFTEQGSWYYEIIEPGFKYNMTDIAAAIGLEQLRRSDALWAIRARYAARYTEAFRAYSEIVPPAEPPPGVQHAWHLYVIRLELDRLNIDRAEMMCQLKACGIGASVHYMPLHLHPYYRTTYGYQPEDLPIATGVYRQLISLPLYARMSEADVERVIDTVCGLVKAHRR